MNNSRSADPGYLHRSETAFLKSEIECGVPRRAKQALQQLCSHYRSGAAVNPGDRNGVEHALLGALSHGLSDEKVRRWALNGIAAMGRPNISLPAVTSALTNFAHEPQVVAAAIAAMFKLDKRNAHSLLAATDSIPPELITLSALQTVKNPAFDLPKITIDVERSDPLILKLVLVLIGLDRAPQHIFDPKHKNNAIVKALGGHHEPIVSQYSVWATMENRALGIGDLGIKLGTLADEPPNVRSYVYRLYAQEKAATTQQHEVIEQGIGDESSEARLGLAKGLRDTYYDGLETLALDWSLNEPDDDVRDHVFDHLVRQASRCESYQRLVLEVYRSESKDLYKRERMEAMASKTDLFNEFRIISLEEDNGLFNQRERITVNTTINNTGNMQGVAVGGRDATSNGSNILTFEQAARAKAILEDTKKAITALPISESEKLELESIVNEASVDPSKGKIAAVVQRLQQFQSGTNSLAGAGEAIAKLSAYGASLLSFIQ